MKKTARQASALDDLCAAAAGVDDRLRSLPDTGTARSSEIKVMEVDAFSSVHDMIHAAITSYGQHATLRQVYQACEERGRIAYKRSGGSRLISNNDHWKSQIRHALYTCKPRFQRVAEGVDLWMITPGFQRVRPQTTTVLIRTGATAGAVSDESRQEGHRRPPADGQQRPVRRARCESELAPPAAPQRRRRTSRQATGAASESPSAQPHGTSLLLPRPEHGDESSDLDHTAAAADRGVPTIAKGGITPPGSSQMDYTVLPSPCVRVGSVDESAWQRAARRLHPLATTGSDDETVPSSRGARSAEAESPSSGRQLYALRSRARPPPGFGDNPDPAAERAAREAHAMTTGPLKKRLKAAARAAEMAATAASAANEEATSTATELGTARRMTPSVVDTSCTGSMPPLTWRSSAQAEASFAAPAQNLRSKGRARGPTSVGPDTKHQTHASQLASLSSQCGIDEDSFPAVQCPRVPLGVRYATQASGRHSTDAAASAAAAPHAAGDAQEGADETDEGGGKRLLRSHAAAAAADLERDGDLDRTGWHS